MKIRADKNRCVSAGQCAATSQELFDQGEEDGVVIVLMETPPKHLQQKARLAAELCPSQAILVED